MRTVPVSRRYGGRNRTFLVPHRFTVGGPVPLFVYGTLRIGHGAHSLIVDDVTRWRFASVDGFAMYNVRPGRALYPVARRLASRRHGRIQGEVLWINPGDRIVDVALMELGAGYRCEVVQANTTSSIGGMPSHVSAFMFTYPHDDFGWRVVSDNWNVVSPPTFQHQDLATIS